MLKEGKFRAIRNLPIGWVLQALHSTDRSEILFRVVLELCLFVASIILFAELFSSYTLIVQIILAAIFTHTIAWFLTGNFWVYMLDSFKVVTNPGLYGVLDFVKLSQRWYAKCDCADAILIYGSACRQMFHGRSDLDLRIIRRVDTPVGLMALVIGYVIRCYSFFIRMPVDLQVVDSMEFLDAQMRDDEMPIVVFKRSGAVLSHEGVSFEEILKNPEEMLKEENNG